MYATAYPFSSDENELERCFPSGAKAREERCVSETKVVTERKRERYNVVSRLRDC